MSDGEVEIKWLEGQRAPREVIDAARREMARRGPRIHGVPPSTEQVETFFGRMAEDIKRAGGHPR
jgi:hypothetical protein